MSKLKILLLLVYVGLFTTTAFSQFGRNKAKYDNFTFQVYNSPNFEIYHYLQNEQVLNMLTQQSEQWYKMHQEVLLDTFAKRNPIIFYNDHADFQQTNSISGSIGVGTGGVTEGFKRRVVMPIAMSNQQTNHVLGHELVHAFQYHLLTFGDSTGLKSISNVPLWMVEGLAEYLSIGRVDAHTAMWMRDAVLNQDIPSIKDLSSGKYFPYRYGQAFWTFLTGIYGDNIIEPFFVATAQYGFEAAAIKVLKTGSENLSNMWENTLKTYYSPLVGEGKKDATIGRKLLSEKNSGKINIAPALSPNGKYVMYLSEKNSFSIELFLANAATGKVIRQLGSTVRDGHLDAFNFIESSGTWSPDSKQFAFVAFKKGENVLVIKNVENGKTITETRLDGVNAFANPAWSPDGKEIAVAGLSDGQIDLYTYNVKSGNVKQLTNDIYSEMQPQWSTDGAQLAYSTDEWSFKNGRTHGKWTANLAVMDMASGTSKIVEIFNTADNLNPVFDQSNDILFLSNQDGFRNMYKYTPSSGQVFQMTDLKTGISGITEYAPAIHAAPSKDRIVYTHFMEGNYTIYSAKEEAFLNREVATDAVNFAASLLPPNNSEVVSIVDRNLANLDSREKIPTSQFSSAKYQPKFKLDYLGGGTGVGVASTGFGPNTGMQGSIDFLFSDILGNNQLYAGVSLNGDIYDFGGQLSYVNRKRRVAWGGGLSHVPYRYGGTRYVGKDTLDAGGGQLFEANEFQVQTERLFEDKASLFAMFPFSKIQRFEASTSLVRYGFRRDQYSVFTDDFGNPLTQTRSEKLDNTPEPFNFANISAALVGDNSFFGMASPMRGYRYRLGVDQYLGDVEYMNLTADARFYQYLKPITIGFRATHFGRYGSKIDQLTPIYNIAYPWYVRGYGYGNSDLVFENNIARNQLVGNKILVSNLEIRLPFTGPKGLAIIGSKFLFSELNLFLDGGMAWNNFDEFKAVNQGNIGTGPEPIFSAGVSARINLFGAMILEPFFAWPLQENTSMQFGLNFSPGW